VASPRRTVLVADDEPRLRRLMARLLEARGYEVLAARDAEEAAELVQQRAGDLAVAVIDARIGPEGAQPLLEQLLVSHPSLRLVMVSGDVLAEGPREIARRFGAAVLRKPFAAEALVRAVAGDRSGEAA
jgi:DNA-binding NtrC family response regulator